MEDHEGVYEQETAADQEVTEPVETGSEEAEQEGSGSEEPGLEETDQEETDQGEGQEETEAEQTGSETGGTGESLEEETGEGPAEGSQEEETVSGNDIVIRGDAVIFPEEYDLSVLESEPVDTEAIVQVIEAQSDNMTAGFACTCFMLGVLAGAMIIAGFCLRRV